MKTLFWFTLFGLFVAATFTLTGCQEEDSKICLDCNWPRHAVQVVMDTDTLFYVSGDSAVSRGFVMVTDQYYELVRGVPVSITMSPVLGLIELENPVLRDTTDDYGRVRFFFRCFAQPGTTIIKAAVCDSSAFWELNIREAQGSIESVTIEVSETNIDPGDSVLVTACVKDSNSVGIPGVSLFLQVPSGRIGHFSPTDSTGCGQAWWWPECCGFWCIHLGTDSACVFVDSLQSSLSMHRVLGRERP